MNLPQLHAGTPLAGTVKISVTRLSAIDSDLRQAYRGLLSPEEKARLSRFRSDTAATQFLVGRALLRTVLSQCEDVPRCAWHFCVNPYGKPQVLVPAGLSCLKFNLSHTRGIVACAVSLEHEIGLDVEYNQRHIDYSRLASYFLSVEEMAALEQLPLPQRRERFYALWTLKEAYVKATGTGLSVPLTAFQFDLERRHPRIRFASETCTESAPWQFRLMEPTPEHTLAVAAPLECTVDVNLVWMVPTA